MSQNASPILPPGPTLTAGSPREIADRAARIELLARLVRDALHRSQESLASTVQTALVALDELRATALSAREHVALCQLAAGAFDRSMDSASAAEPSGAVLALDRSHSLVAQAWVARHTLS